MTNRKTKTEALNFFSLCEGRQWEKVTKAIVKKCMKDALCASTQGAIWNVLLVQNMLLQKYQIESLSTYNLVHTNLSFEEWKVNCPLT